MTASLRRPGRPAKAVKNLGWLIKNWKEVKGFIVTVGDDRNDATLVAVLADSSGEKGTYVTPFASKTVLANWLNRPIFRGLPILWYGRETTVSGKGLV